MKNNVIIALAAVAMVACLVGSGVMAQQVRRTRDELKLIGFVVRPKDAKGLKTL